MKQSRFTDSQIMAILKQAEAGAPVPQLCREHGMSSATFYKWRAKPACLRCDNGPEYIGKTMLEWALRRRITIIHTQPRNPQQNAYVERYNRTVRYDWLAQNLFSSLGEVQHGATA